MPIYQENQKKFYSTRAEVLKLFREEENKKCHCKTEIWAGNINKRFCFNCARKENLTAELKKKDSGKSKRLKILEGSPSGAV